MFQSPYLTVTKSCKYCGALETRPLLVTTVVGFVVGDGPGLGTLTPALFAWADQQGCFGLVDL